ncbi:hypothetical protein QJS04_geneDACA022451 [Acorus gramineus]|uniref:Uncharacterized protein n=1 Tax=Acorus gramineus TaxID=55184 RepID=A0AAV9AMG6_ACOGR|nr:hypothetical protein QJS04_geneDACA022451 [Acorus gramineus]
MMHTKSESDVTSLAPSSPSRSPKRQAYYVQSPSRDSHDGDKSSSMQATPVYNSPMESPSHPSYGRHSRASSASRFSGTFRSSSGRKANRKRNDKGWPECNVIQEEGSYDDLDDDRISVYNPASLFGIHVSSSAVNLVFSEIALATGQVQKYYQPRKSHRVVSVILQGEKVPLYGAGAGMSVTSNGGPVPLTLDFTIKARGEV